MIREELRAVAALALAVNRELVVALADKDAAIESVVRRDPTVLRDVEMSYPEGCTLGIGAVDEARLGRAIALLSCTNRLPARPRSTRSSRQRSCCPCRSASRRSPADRSTT